VNWLLGLLILAGLYWFFILRPGRLDFWQVAAQHPDKAYEYFRASPVWKIFEGKLPDNYKELVPKQEWVGPFKLYVPKIGASSVTIFGKHPEYLASQNEFLRQVGGNT